MSTLSTPVKVARYLMARPLVLAMPWLILMFDFAVNILIAAGIPLPHGTQHYTGALVAVYICMLVFTAVACYQHLPAALALGITRRCYYAATALLVIAQAAVFAAGLAILQALEGATGGWGFSLHFFRVPYLFAGPWYLTLLTSFVGLALMGAWGVWFGLVTRRWGTAGLLGFIAAQVFAIALFLVIAARASAWNSIASFFTTLTIQGLTGLLAALAVVLLAGGFATIRRVTI